MATSSPVSTADGKALLDQLRPLILFCIASVIVVGMAMWLAAQTSLNSYEQLERDAMHQKAEQVYRAFEADLRQLNISNRDYANWDDATNYLDTRNRAFIESNMQFESLTNMHVDLVWIVNDKGENVFSTLVNRESETSTEPAPQRLLNQLKPFIRAGDYEAARLRPATLIARTSHGLTAVSIAEITQTNLSEPSGATMMFARFIKDADVQRVRETSQLPVTMTYLSSPASVPENLSAETLTWLNQKSQDKKTFVYSESKQKVIANTVLRNIAGQPLAVFTVNSPRHIVALGSQTTWYLFSGIMVLFVAFAITAFWLFSHLLKLQQRNLQHRQQARKQQRANRKNLLKQARQDSLTNLPNRLYLHAKLPFILRRVAENERMLALVYLDIDHFKNINDSRSHSCGDQLLQVIAERLRSVVSAEDLIVRMGGDEFVVVASLMNDVSAIERFVTRIQAIVAADILVEDQPVNVTSSVGIAVYPRDGLDSETLLKHADIALYQSKESGRNCYRFFSADMDVRVSQSVALEQALRRAIGTREIYMEYQPIVDLHSGKVASLEALMRWRNPLMGQIPPSEFIPIAEKSGLIVELGTIGLKEVINQIRYWIDTRVPIVPIAINVSVVQMERGDFVKLVKELTTQAGVDTKWLRFEITESAVMKEPTRFSGVLHELRKLGCQILIDDFGTGYSSLSHLDRLPVDTLKIDRAFVRDLGRLQGQSPIIDTVVNMARRLNLKTVAEGVETPEQASLLRDLGCDYAQGFLYGKPASVLKCRALLEHLQRERPLTETTVLRVLTSKLEVEA